MRDQEQVDLQLFLDEPGNSLSEEGPLESMCSEQVRRFGVPNRYHQRASSAFVGARLDGLLAPPTIY